MNTYIQTATKTKRTLVRAECARPPREIRDNTKARREWLAAKVAEINAHADRKAKIVGMGSYQSVSVYKIEQVAGRLRLRGACQFCMHSQVVSNDVLVLHGYERPGDGRVWGRCPGVDLKPLNVDKSRTEKWLAEAIAAHDKAVADYNVAKSASDEVTDRLYKGLTFEARDTANRARPRKPPLRAGNEEALRAYRVAYQLWAQQFPLSAECDLKATILHAADEAKRRADNTRRHFQTILDSKIHGTPLTEEVVA